MIEIDPARSRPDLAPDGLLVMIPETGSAGDPGHAEGLLDELRAKRSR